jgi:hypothetical protein
MVKSSKVNLLQCSKAAYGLHFAVPALRKVKKIA